MQHSAVACSPEWEISERWQHDTRAIGGIGVTPQKAVAKSRNFPSKGSTFTCRLPSLGMWQGRKQFQ